MKTIEKNINHLKNDKTIKFITNLGFVIDPECFYDNTVNPWYIKDLNHKLLGECHIVVEYHNEKTSIYLSNERADEIILKEYSEENLNEILEFLL